MKMWLPVLLLLSLASCNSDQATSYKVPKEAPAHAAGEVATKLPFHWDAPKGWTPVPASGMRAASFSVPGVRGGKPADFSVVTFPGDAGGDLMNVNRWRGQLGLEPVEAAALAKLTKSIDTPAGRLLVVELAGKQDGTPARTLAAILKTNDASWFFKLTGDDAAVAASRDAFVGLVGSLHPAH